MGESQTVEMNVLDVIPYRHGVYCRIEDREPFVNEIVGRDWSENGEKIIFMLDTHNFLFHSPEDKLNVVPLSRGPSFRIFEVESKDDFMAKRPKPKKVCEACGGKGHILEPKNV